MLVVNEPLLDYFRAKGSCEVCGQRENTLHPHHIKPRGHGGGSRLDAAVNLIALCGLCHAGRSWRGERVWNPGKWRGMRFGVAQRQLPGS